MDDFDRDYDDINEDIYEYLDRLTDIVESSQKGFLGNVKFNRDEALTIIDDLRLVIPNEVSRAKDIISKKERIISDARAEADKIIKDAETEAQKIVSQHETTLMVNAWAEQREKDANDYFRDVCTGGNRYAEDRLGAVAEIVEKRLEEFKTTASATEEELRAILQKIYENKDYFARSDDFTEYQEDDE